MRPDDTSLKVVDGIGATINQVCDLLKSRCIYHLSLILEVLKKLSNDFFEGLIQLTILVINF